MQTNSTDVSESTDGMTSEGYERSDGKNGVKRWWKAGFTANHNTACYRKPSQSDDDFRVLDFPQFFTRELNVTFFCSRAAGRFDCAGRVGYGPRHPRAGVSRRRRTGSHCGAVYRRRFVTSGERLPMLPSTPTTAEAGTPPAVMARRHKEIVAALALPDVRAQFLNRALIPAPSESPAAYSTNAAIPAGQPRGASRQAYKTFLRPYALRIPKEAEGMVRVLHVHGTGLDLARIKDYPCDVINLSDRLAGNPSLRDLRP